MKDVERRAAEEIGKREKAENTRKLAKAIGFGAIKFGILKVSPEKNVIFDLKQSLEFEGETGPYIQYSHARICSILRKHGKSLSSKVDCSLLNDDHEIALIRKLEEFKKVVADATDLLRPHLIANHTYAIAKAFSEFYHACPVLQADEKTKIARLLLCDCTRQVLEIGLNLLGIDAPERM